MIAASVVSTHARHPWLPIGLSDVQVDPVSVEARRLMDAAARRVVIAFEGDEASSILAMLGLDEVAA